jgi:hypothetical protein
MTGVKEVLLEATKLVEIFNMAIKNAESHADFKSVNIISKTN